MEESFKQYHAISDGEKFGQIPIVIQANMKFDRTLGGAEIGAGKDRQTQINGRSIQRVQLVLELEVMARNLALAAQQQLAKQGLVKAVGLAFIDPTQIGTRHPTTAQVIEPMGLCRNTFHDIAQAVAASQLCQGKRHKLRPTGCCPEGTARMVLFGQGLKFMSRNKS